MRFRTVPVLIAVLLSTVSPAALSLAQQAASESNPVAELRQWLNAPPKSRPKFQSQGFSHAALTSEQADEFKALLWRDYTERNKAARKQEWSDKKIEIGDRTMKFEYKVFGEKPKEGRSLYISMHGGGGTGAQVNDQQWRNQIGLYKPKEGVYLAPRAPTDTWNLWHQAHIDEFFKRIIQDAILFEDVNPNRVYLMGYSAGGDGVYQLAPRMADSLAAAAMMAGHPNDASPLGLRNIGFTLHMGGKDSAYKRNDVAREWKKKLAKLQEDDPKGYQHKVVIHEQFAHWMNREDAVAVPWMAKFTRNPRPEKIVWQQSSVTLSQYYWLGHLPGKAVPKAKIVVSRSGQEFTIEESKDAGDAVLLMLNDAICDLDKPIVIEKDGEKRTRKVQRKGTVIYESIENRGDPEMIFSAVCPVPLN